MAKVFAERRAINLKGNALNDPEMLRTFAESQGIEVLEKKTGGFLGTLSKAIDVLNTGAYAVGGILSGTSPLAGIQKKIRPSEAIFGKQAENKTWTDTAMNMPETAVRFVSDVLFDPVTYLTLGTGSLFKPAIKVGVNGVENVFINKTGKELLKELADDLVTKGVASAEAKKIAKNQIYRLVGSAGAKTMESRGGGALIKKALEKQGQEFTGENVKKLIQDGASGLLDPGGLKYMGKVLVEGKTLKSPFVKTFNAISQTLEKIEGGKEFVEGLGKVRHAFSGLWNRDLGLPGKYKTLKQGMIDNFDYSMTRVQDQVSTIFAGITKENRIAIANALDKGTIDALDPGLQPLARRVKTIFQAMAREEDQRGLLDYAMEDYVTHLYKNKEKASSVLSEIRKGQPSALLQYAKGRVLHTFEDAKALGLDPEEDVANILYTRMIAHEKAKLTQDFFYGAPGKASRLIKEYGLMGEKLKTEKIPFEVFRNERKVITALDKAIELHKANPVTKFADIYGKLAKDLNPAPYGFSSLDDAQRALDELRNLKNIKEGIGKTVSSADRMPLLGETLKILGNKSVGEQGTLGLAPVVDKLRFADETFNDLKDIVNTAESFTLEELKMSDAGKRFFADTGEVIGLKSTFPDWVPSDLRRRTLFDQVIRHFEKGTVPKALKRTPLGETITEATSLGDVSDAKRLYDVVKERIAKLSGLDSVEKLNEVVTTPSLFPDIGGPALRDISIIRQIKEKNPELARRVLEMGEQWTRLGDVGLGVPDEFKNVFIPENIAKDILTIGKSMFADEDVKTLLKGYDKYMNFWKGSVTVLFPSFHGRNAISNVANMALDTGLEAVNPLAHKTALSILKGADGEITTALGEKIAFSEIRKLMKQHQVFQSSFSRTDIGRLLKQEGVKKQAALFNLADKGRRFGRAIENEARLVSFVKQLKRGFSPEDAAARVKDFLFDYDNLSKFEKDVLRRMIPFYTFTRKNIALQLKTLFTNPGATAAQAKAYRAIEDMFAKPKTEEEEKYAPEFIKEGLHWIVNHRGDDRTFLVGFDLPIESAFKFLNHPLKDALSYLTPVLKIPLEAATGKNFFTDRNIKDDDSGIFAKDYPNALKKLLDYTETQQETKDGRTFVKRTVDPKKKHIFQNIATLAGTSRFVSMRNIEQLNSFMTSFQNALEGRKVTMEDRINILGFFTGLRTMTRSIEAEKAFQEKEEARSIKDVLERKGVGATLEKFFIPEKNEKFNKGFGKLFNVFKRKQ